MKTPYFRITVKRISSLYLRLTSMFYNFKFLFTENSTIFLYFSPLLVLYLIDDRVFRYTKIQMKCP